MADVSVINYSEFATLADCEQRWFYGYRAGLEEDRSEARGLHRGTLIHVWADRWLRNLGATLPDTWTDNINTGGKPGEERTLSLSDFDSSDVELALWLAERYERHYGSGPPSSWNVIATEEWLAAQLGDGQTVVGRTDGLIEIEGELWLREVKSYGNRQRLDTVGVEPQPSIYYALVEANYRRPLMGILYDGVYTYRWKPEKPTQQALIDQWKAEGHTNTLKDMRLAAKAQIERMPGVDRPVEESFRREWPDRSADQVAISMQQLRSAINRRSEIIEYGDAMPNVGRSCSWCGFKAQCWADLQGVEPSDIEIEDDDNQELEFDD